MSRSDGTTRIGTCVLLVCMYLCDLYCPSTCPQRKLTNRMKYGRGTARLPIFLFVNDLVDVFFSPVFNPKDGCDDYDHYHRWNARENIFSGFM